MQPERVRTHFVHWMSSIMEAFFCLFFHVLMAYATRYANRNKTASSQNLPPCRPNSFAIYLLKPLFENIICSPMLLMILFGKKRLGPRNTITYSFQYSAHFCLKIPRCIYLFRQARHTKVLKTHQIH